MCRSGEGYANSMISIPITDEAYEALKARNPGINQDQTARGRNGQRRIWVDPNLSTASWNSGAQARAIPTSF